ncbi:MAG: exopolysaccharide biosynthesis polyprenyl glycosylphosphotransferase [Roseimicrobium sp.]
MLDAFLCIASFWTAAALRFNRLTPKELSDYSTTVLIAAFVLPAACYVLGLYMSPHRMRRWQYRVLLLAAAVGIMATVILMKGSLDFSSRVGRGVLVVGLALTSTSLALHHFFLRRLLMVNPERLAFIVGEPRDATLASIFVNLAPKQLSVAGLFVRDSQQDIASELPIVGTWATIGQKIAEMDIRRVLCTEEHLRDPGLAGALRVLRYDGIRVDTLAHAFEEDYQTVPLDLVTDAWLLHAAEHPEVVYIRKLKRIFDITTSIGLMILASPVFIVAVLLVWLTSGRPIFYKQIRSGRLGKPFEILKLRTMRRDAERHGAQWSSVKGDTRVTTVGKVLRKFRVDEIPQLWNILRGDMSFVGPRPERPEFVEDLAVQVPFYKERLLLPPGLTGWAQVNYPYAASVEDARHKLEYDLYYLKHMGLLLDLFIILDTVRTVLWGGASTPSATQPHVTAHLRGLLEQTDTTGPKAAT